MADALSRKSRGVLDTWSASLYCIRHRSQVYDSRLEELPEGYGYTVDNEYCVSSTDRWSVGDDHTGVRGHVVGMRPGSQGLLGGAFALSRVTLQQQLSSEYIDGAL